MPAAFAFSAMAFQAVMAASISAFWRIVPVASCDPVCGWPRIAAVSSAASMVSGVRPTTVEGGMNEPL